MSANKELDYKAIESSISTLEKEVAAYEDKDDSVCGALTAYIRDVRKWPLLSKEEEDAVWANPEDKKMMEKLVNGNLRLVIAIAMKAMPYNHDNESNFMDLIQAGNLGLLHAVKMFKTSHGTRFTTYAYNWIKAYVKKEHELQRCGLIRKPVHVLAAFSTLTKVESKLEGILNRKPTDEELQVALEGVFSKEKFHELMEVKNTQSLSLDAACGDEEDTTIGDYVADEDSDADIEQKEMKDAIMDRIKKVLTKDEQLVIMARYGLGKFYGTTRTLDETAEVFVTEGYRDKALSKERVRQIESHALEALRADPEMAELFGG